MYCIRTLARAVPSGEEELATSQLEHLNRDSGYYKHNDRWYRLADDISPVLLKEVCSGSTAFSLQVVTQHYANDCNDSELCLFLETNRRCEKVSAQLDIVDEFFDYVSGPRGNSDELDIKIQAENIADAIPEIYGQLRKLHAEPALRVPSVIDRQHRIFDVLLPKLRQYQIDALNWMVHREQQTKWLTSDLLIEIQPKAITANVGLPSFYCDQTTGNISDYENATQPLPSGGILADEMGLGKTVEMLALILANPRVLSPADQSARPRPSKRKRNENNWRSAKLWCICGQTTINKHNQKQIIRCNNCDLYQHIKCVGPMSPVGLDEDTNSEQRVPYACPNCWQKPAYLKGRLIESKATIVVAPASIKVQWMQEIERHVRGLRVLIYEGVRHSGWINPDVLAAYDVVIIDYHVLCTELYFQNTNRRQQTERRNGNELPRYMPVRTPLLLVRWWRVCLDESQMVETTNSRAAQMAKILAATHRWYITGTPIEKSLHTLYAFVHFLGVIPYENIRVWRTAIEAPFKRNQIGPLLRLMQHIMWRNCKSTVKSSIGIPPQTFRTHLVEMTDIQAFFYSTQHALCSVKFSETVETVLGRASLGISLDTPIGRMTPLLLNKIMEPLRILRQDCTVPSVLRGQLEQEGYSIDNSILSTEELHRKLMYKQELDCKTHLRSIVSNLNGLAALDAIDSDYKAAIAKYRVVLRYAAENKGIVCVDSLLQIHALHNLIKINQLNGSNLLSQPEAALYLEQVTSLKKKYTANCHEFMAKYYQKLYAAMVETNKLMPQHEHEHAWWCTLLTEFASTKDLPSLVGNFVEPTEFHIKLKLTRWLSDVVKNRKSVQEAFASLKFFEENIRNPDLMTTAQTERLDSFVRSALDCHLDVVSTNFARNRNAATNKWAEKLANHGKPAAKELCEMCVVRRKLTQYECIIFDKTLDERSDHNETIGTWHYSNEERLLRALYGPQARNSSWATPTLGTLVEHGERHLALLDAYKAEYKEYSSLWVEINYAVAAFDELSMCQLRMRSVNEIGSADLQLPLSLYQTHLLLDTDQVSKKRAEFTAEESDAQLGFVRSKGTIKYLQHLQQRRMNAEPVDVCPVCTMPPNEKYAVLLCGHHLCFACLLHITNKKMATSVDCPVCRNNQLCTDIYYVNSRLSLADNQGFKVRGDHPPKVTEIVRTVLQLLDHDADIKVLIFSNWEHLLVTIANALIVNKCKVRTKSTPFYKCVNDFKNEQLGVTCLLLPLANGSKGLNLVQATHVFLVEPILDPGMELQAIGRVHRIGQTRPTTVHRFIMKETIEETIYNTLIKDESTWKGTRITMGHLFRLIGGRQTES